MSDKTFTFQDYWTAMSPDPKYNIRREDAERAWDTHPEKHAPIMRWLRKRGAYPQRNPYYFILDFQSCDTSYLHEPTNYQGRALPADKIIVSARYREQWGLYELGEAEVHGMDIRYPGHILILNREIVEKINNHVDWVQVKVPYMPEDFVFCTRANAAKYHIEIIADPRNPASNAGSMDSVGTSLQD
jgi:hypothetical protein